MDWLKKWSLFWLCCGSIYAATVSNPITWVDNPDPSIVRVDDTYYMVTTTMHFAPGDPIMASKDLAQWRTVGYAYQTLTNNDNMNLNAGQNAYGKGSWASSIRYHKGFFYVLTPSYTTNRTHLYKTADIENGPWTEVTLPFYHDPSLFFDDDGSVWVFYGSGDQISYVELNGDASAVKSGGRSGKLGGVSVNQVTGTTNYYVQQEGAHMEKVNGEYYLFTISWPAGNCRSAIVYRSKSLLSGYSGKIFLQNNGVAQGGIFDTPEGKWYALLFRDSGPVGRIPYLVPTSWQDGWPVADGSKAPSTLELPANALPGYGMVTSDDFDSEILPLEWQWNHNPDNKNWSLTANPGNLRITTSRTDSRIINAKNTLTQRTFGPKCSGRISLDASGMKDGDIAGLVALQDTKGFVGITKENGNYKVVMYTGSKDGESLKASESFSSSKIFLRIDFDLPLDRGTASFYYSANGSDWTKIGSDLALDYSLGMFVGYRFGLFNYATKTAGGYVDFDWFKIGTDYKDEIYLDNLQDTTPPTPYNDIAVKIPGKIEAENYDVGKPNRAYYDKDSDNQGNAYREDGVDIVQLDSLDKSKGFAIGYTEEGEWMRYSVNVSESSVYEIRVNMATASENAGVKLYLDGKAISENIIAEQGEDWSNYSAISAKTSEISAGEHALKIEIVGNYVNVDWIEFCKESCSENPLFIKKLTLDNLGLQNFSIYSLNGSFIGKIKASSVRDAHAKVQSLISEKGVYLIKSTNGFSHRFMITK